MELARHTIPEVLPCPLRESNLILPILRCETNCDVQLPLYHCNHCGMEAPRHTWDSWARPPEHGATERSRLAPTNWLDALAESWERKADEERGEAKRWHPGIGGDIHYSLRTE
jgi:hypothetical protein